MMNQRMNLSSFTKPGQDARDLRFTKPGQKTRDLRFTKLGQKTRGLRFTKLGHRMLAVLGVAMLLPAVFAMEDAADATMSHPLAAIPSATQDASTHATSSSPPPATAPEDPMQAGDTSTALSDGAAAEQPTLASDVSYAVAGTGIAHGAMHEEGETPHVALTEADPATTEPIEQPQPQLLRRQGHPRLQPRASSSSKTLRSMADEYTFS